MNKKKITKEDKFIAECQRKGMLIEAKKIELRLQVRAEFVDTRKEFKWRLVKGKEKSNWYKYYEGFLKHQFKDGQTWYLCTAYWDGSFPIETPFQLKDYNLK